VPVNQSPNPKQPSSSSPGSGSDTGGKESFQISAPSISLPKDGGAIRGIGEKFTANPVTGTGYLSVPIATSPGRSGFGPQLGLSYDSGAGNGPFGIGWSLSLPAITLRTDKGLPQYRDTENRMSTSSPVPRTWYRSTRRTPTAAGLTISKAIAFKQCWPNVNTHT
jgi:Salmonella virulence plasmid 65kDa B protein